jgi:hypothetical protein
LEGRRSGGTSVRREFAFEERKTITDLINDGLDRPLPTHNYATTAGPAQKETPTLTRLSAQAASP